MPIQNLQEFILKGLFAMMLHLAVDVRNDRILWPELGRASERDRSSLQFGSRNHRDSARHPPRTSRRLLGTDRFAGVGGVL